MRYIPLCIGFILLPLVFIVSCGDEVEEVFSWAPECPVVAPLHDGVCTPDLPLSSGEEPATEWQVAYPEMVLPEGGNPMTPERIELGRLLFFDPILGGTNEISCAHCHHPDYGMSDGRGLSMGVGGTGFGPHRVGGAPLTRSAPSIWNAAFNTIQFWDGRVDTLEEQAMGPIESELEMASELPALEIEVANIPAYAEMFETVFPDDDPAVTGENIVLAIAAFERTVLAVNSPFDQYVGGNEDALTAAELRGWDLFRTEEINCIECHTLPNLGGHDFAVTGIAQLPELEEDLGRSLATENPEDDFAFKIPTLRNIALTGPYMHHGGLTTLEEVVDFYAEGAGAGEEEVVANLDERLFTFELTDEQRADMVSFLEALTDESAMPAIPESVPSGLPVPR
jgi:cytochrome c peroxidase